MLELKRRSQFDGKLDGAGIDLNQFQSMLNENPKQYLSIQQYSV